MHALLDGDIFAFRGAASAEREEQWIALCRMEEMVKQTLEAVDADSYQIFLTGTKNFRRELDPQYKANRTAPKPIHLAACKDFLEQHYGAIWCDQWECEADDALGFNQDPNGSTIICSIDKDLLQVPGKHYNFLHKE